MGNARHAAAPPDAQMIALTRACSVATFGVALALAKRATLALLVGSTAGPYTGP